MWEKTVLCAMLLAAFCGGIFAADVQSEIKLGQDGAGEVKIEFNGRETVPSHVLQMDCRSDNPATLEIKLRSENGQDFSHQLKLTGGKYASRMLWELGKTFRWDGRARLLSATIRGIGHPGDRILIQNFRIDSFQQLKHSAVAVFPTPPKKKTFGADAVKVFFEFDNNDLRRCTLFREHGNNKEILLPCFPDYDGFRDDLVENASALVRRVDSPLDADVIVYSRCIPGGDQRIREAVKTGKRLLIYGDPADPEIRALAPLRLTAMEDSTMLPRLRVVMPPEDCRFPDAVRDGSSAGQHFRIELLRGQVLVSGAPGEVPLLVEDGNVIQSVNGPGQSLIDNGPFRDLMMLRLVLGKDATRQKRLTAEKQRLATAESERRREKLSTLGVDPEEWHIGVSENNFGSFGWALRAGLVAGMLEKDLRISLGSQFFRFSDARTQEIPIGRWKVGKADPATTPPLRSEHGRMPPTDGTGPAKLNWKPKLTFHRNGGSSRFVSLSRRASTIPTWCCSTAGKLDEPMKKP